MSVMLGDSWKVSYLHVLVDFASGHGSSVVLFTAYSLLVKIKKLLYSHESINATWHHFLQWQ